MRKLIYLLALLPFLSTAQSTQPLKAPNGLVVIGSTIAPSAYVDIQGTAKGFLAPRLNMTQQNAITSPATGLLIFNTTTGLYTFYNGSAWVAVGGGSGYDSLQAMYNVDPAKLYVTDGVNTTSIDPANVFVSSDIITSNIEPAVGASDVSGAQAYNTITNSGGNVIGQNYVLDNNGHSYLSRGDGSTVMKSNNFQVETRADNLTADRSIHEADANGTRVMSVNGTPADTSGNVVVGTTGDYIPLAGTDVGSPVTGEILFTNGTQSLNISKSALTFNDGVGNSYGITHNEFTGFVNYGVDNPIGGSVGMSSDPVNDICEIKVHGSLATEGSLRTYSTDTRLTLNSPDDIGTATIKQSNDDFYISTADAGNEIKLQFPSPNSGANGVASIKPITDGSTKPLAYVEDIPLVDSVPTDGSANAVSSNGTFDALATKQPTITGAATTITGSNLTANRAVISNGSGKVAVSAVTTDTEVSYLSGVTGPIQTQINAKGSGDALTTNPLSQFAPTTSLQLKNTISDETGSGSLVFATSPTLVTPALGTPSSVNLLNGTGLPQSGVVNLVTDLAAKAPLASPAFTGNPTVPNQTLGDNDTSAANTAFVQAAIGAITPTTKTSLGLATTTTDNAISRYDGTGGNTQNSVVQIDDNGGIIVPGVTSSSFTAKKIEYDNTINQWIAYDNDSNVALNLGYETWFLCVNNTGSSIPNGSVVYISGASSGTPTIALAKADAGSTAVGIGITTEVIANGATGKVTQSGLVNGVNTGSLSAGAVYVSETTAGALTNTIPSAPNYRMRVGFVGVVNAITGTVLVTPSTAALGNGTANQIEGMNAAGTAKEVKSIVGTANQIAITHTAGQIQFGFPSTIVIPTGSTATTPAQNDYSTAVATTAYVDRRFPFMRLSSAYVLTSQTALQKAFNVGASSGGALTAGTRLYYFTGQISLSALSATNGTVSFGWLGTATIGSVRYTSFTVKAATPAASLMGNVTSTAGTVITATTTGTTAVLQVSGYVSVSGAGTLIPAVGMSVAAAANVDANSGIVFNDLGASTATASPDVN